MTWSIIARDPSTGQIGIAVATRFFAVGARVPHIAPGIGGIATQALVNPYYCIDGVKLLREGRSPREVIDTLSRIANEAFRSEDVIGPMRANGIEPVGGSPEDFARFMEREVDKMAKLATLSGLKN